MAQPTTTPDAQATADAAQVIFNLRMQYISEIPMAAWRIMAHAEAKLNRDLDGYLRAGKSLESEDRQRMSA